MNQTRKTIITVAITAIVVGGGVYLWQIQNLTNEGLIEQSTIDKASSNTPQLNTTTEKSPSVKTTQSIQGTIIYWPSGSIGLDGVDGWAYTLTIEDSTIIKIPENRYDEQIKKLTNEAGRKYPWFGLISDLSLYIKNGEMIKVKGTIDSRKYIIIANEIEL